MASVETTTRTGTRKRFRTGVLGAVLLGALLAPAAPARAAPGPLTPPPGLMHPWAALNQVGPVPTDADAAALGRNFDLVVIRKETPASTVALMRAANPDVTVLVYHNGAFAQRYEGTTYPEAWYARDALGRKTTSRWFGNYLMHVASPGWRGEVVRQCLTYRAATGADGCYTDMLMTAPLFDNYMTSKPINPATGRVWTFSDFQRAVEEIADLLRVETAGPLAANGVGRGQRWFAPGGASSRTLTNHVDAAHCEICWRDRIVAYDEWPTVPSWKQDVDMIVEAEAAGKTLLVQTKVWPRTRTEPLPPTHLVERWRWFTAASFLLGTSGRSWYLFNADKTLAGMKRPDPATSVRVGVPTAPYRLTGVVYSRTFTDGFAAVNPGGTAGSVRLPSGTWRRAAGPLQSGTVSLGPHTGAVWMRP